MKITIIPVANGFNWTAQTDVFYATGEHIDRHAALDAAFAALENWQRSQRTAEAMIRRNSWLGDAS